MQSIRVSCGKYTATLEFCENRDTDIMIPIKELIMSAYDLRKQKNSSVIGRFMALLGGSSSPF